MLAKPFVVNSPLCAQTLHWESNVTRGRRKCQRAQKLQAQPLAIHSWWMTVLMAPSLVCWSNLNPPPPFAVYSHRSNTKSTNVLQHFMVTGVFFFLTFHCQHICQSNRLWGQETKLPDVYWALRSMLHRKLSRNKQLVAVLWSLLTSQFPHTYQQLASSTEVSHHQ